MAPDDFLREPLERPGKRKQGGSRQSQQPGSAFSAASLNQTQTNQSAAEHRSTKRRRTAAGVSNQRREPRPKSSNLTHSKSSELDDKGANVSVSHLSNLPTTAAKAQQASSTPAADPAKDAQTRRPASPADSPETPASSIDPRAINLLSPSAASPLDPVEPLRALPNFEWISTPQAQHPEIFLTRLQLRSFILLFSDLAPSNLNPRRFPYVLHKMIHNPALSWSFQEMGKIMQCVVGIIGVEDFVTGISERYKHMGYCDKWNEATANRTRLLIKELLRRAWTETMWEDFYGLLYGALGDCSGQDRESLAGIDDKLAATKNNSRHRKLEKIPASKKKQERIKGKQIRELIVPNDTFDVLGSDRRTRTCKPRASDPAVKFELLRLLLGIAASCSKKIKQRLQANDESAKVVLNATRTAERTLKAELSGLTKDLRHARQTKKLMPNLKSKGKEDIKPVSKKPVVSSKQQKMQHQELAGLQKRLEEIQDKIAQLSLTGWLELRNLDPRSSASLGSDPLGNCYYIIPHDHDDEDNDRLTGYASWVLCQKDPVLKHPLGETWTGNDNNEADGSSDICETRHFYAIDGPEAVKILINWIRRRCNETAASSGGLGHLGKEAELKELALERRAVSEVGACDVLLAKLQHFQEMLVLNLVRRQGGGRGQPCSTSGV